MSVHLVYALHAYVTCSPNYDTSYYLQSIERARKLTEILHSRLEGVVTNSRVVA